MQNKKKLITLTPRMEQMISEIKDEMGYLSDGAVIQQAIIALHSKIFPAYTASPRKRAVEEETVTATESKLQRYYDLAKQLDGEVYDKNGETMVRYYTYIHKERYEQNLPLESLTPELLGMQYSPTKELVKKLQNDGKCKYPVIY